MLSVWLNNFQYQDKVHLRDALNDVQLHIPFELAVQQFVDDFDQSYSVDAPYPKRIGRWVGLYAPKSVIDNLSRWAAEPNSDQKAVRCRQEFGKALKLARTINRATRPPMAA
jgi:hypothetical protein